MIRLDLYHNGLWIVFSLTCQDSFVFFFLFLWWFSLRIFAENFVVISICSYTLSPFGGSCNCSVYRWTRRCSISSSCLVWSLLSNASLLHPILGGVSQRSYQHVPLFFSDSSWLHILRRWKVWLQPIDCKNVSVVHLNLLFCFWNDKIVYQAPLSYRIQDLNSRFKQH